MRLNYELKTLRLIHPFILSDSRIESKDVIIIRLQHDGITGIGESSPSRYYGEPPESVLECLKEASGVIGRFTDPSKVKEIMQSVQDSFPKNCSARSGLDMALHDWISKKMKQPLHQFFGLDKTKAPLTSFTIGIDELRIIDEKTREADPYPILKIKLGVGDQDYEIVKTIRMLTDKTLRVDVNEGWTKEEAAKKIEWLAGQGVELIEQPLPKENNDDMLWLKERSVLPLFADESVKTNSDIATLKGRFDGINIKLDKCGGLMPALQMIKTAREQGLKVMLGCMIQTAIGTTAAANISPLIDYADLDGHLLIDDGQFRGMETINGKIILNDNPGIGIFENDALQTGKK